MEPENTERKQRGRPFRPGQSGNPAGRPKGARNCATLAAEALLEGEAEALTRKAVDLALAGDTTALRLCIERLVPPRKDRPITFELPPMVNSGDAVQALGAVLKAVADGKITPSEALAVTGLIEAHRRAIGPEPLPLPAPAAQIRVCFARSDPEALTSEQPSRYAVTAQPQS